MKYLCLIYDEEKQFVSMPKPELEGIMKEYRSFSEEIRKAGTISPAINWLRRVRRRPFGSGTARSLKQTVLLQKPRSNSAGFI
jgi:hypothetical protein